MDRSREHTVSNTDVLSEVELDKALFSVKTGKAPGLDEIPAEVYQNSKTAQKLHRTLRIIFDTECMREELVRDIFIMIY